MALRKRGLISPLTLIDQNKRALRGNKAENILNGEFYLLGPIFGINRNVSRITRLSSGRGGARLLKLGQLRGELGARNEELLLHAIDFFRNDKCRAWPSGIGKQGRVIMNPDVLRGLPRPFFAPIDIDNELGKAG